MEGVIISGGGSSSGSSSGNSGSIITISGGGGVGQRKRLRARRQLPERGQRRKRPGGGGRRGRGQGQGRRRQRQQQQQQRVTTPSPERAHGGADLNTAAAECVLQQLFLTVPELGLGYDSDEVVPFYYCSGACHARPTNYDLVVSHLARTRRQSMGGVDARRCCRPVEFHDLAFFDKGNQPRVVRNFLASACACVG
ncbi:glial cell line-derived neurotrophic factor [Petromyzon marinus]|uniref:glial cell line-derived neurotrophic factor n=1 Tax=Petromyzon marinus TaxID=7757 RepID=UPI003F6F7BD7